MKRIVWMLAICFVCLSPWAGAEEFFPLDKLKPGMQGYGKTVFQGTRIETFPVKVIGVLRKSIADSSVILIQVEGGYPVQHKCGVVAGMSGSPIYIQGKLLGAIAYAWAFPMEPIAGVTPISEMLPYLPHQAQAEIKLKADKPPQMLYRLAQTLKIRNRSFTKVLVSENPAPNAPADTMLLTPCNSFLELSGFSPRTFKRLKAVFEPLGLVPMESMGRASKIARTPPLVPGAALGVQLLDGDMHMGGTGTLTYRKGNDVLAFGHALMNAGAISLPLSSCYIDGIWPSYMRSYKMSSTIEIIGELRQDRSFGISGKLHASPPMVPVVISLADPERKFYKDYHVKVAPHKFLAPMLLNAAVAEALGVNCPYFNENSAALVCELTTPGQSFKFRDMVIGPNIDFKAGDKIQEYLSQIQNNSYAPCPLTRLKISITVTGDKQVQMLDKLYTDKPFYNPGDNIKLNIALKSFTGTTRTETLEIPVPLDIKGNTINIGAAGGESIPKVKKLLNYPLCQPKDLAQFLLKLESQEKLDTLAVYAAYPSSSLRIREQYFPAFPASWLPLFLEAPNNSGSLERDFFEAARELKAPVSGYALINVPILKFREPLPDTSPSRDSGGDNLEPSAPEPPARETAAPQDKADNPQPSPVSSSTLKWEFKSFEDFIKGETQGVAISAQGELRLAPKLDVLYQQAEGVIWSLVHNKEFIYAGVGNEGIVLKLDAQGKLLTRYQLPEACVTALALAPGGGLWIGTSPRGRLYFLNSQGKLTLVADFDNSYIWELAVAGDKLLCACGNPAALLAVKLNTSGSKPAVWYQGKERHVRALAQDADGNFYFSTAEPGVVYRLKPGSQATPLLEAPASLDSLVLDKYGRLWVAGGDQLYVLGPKGLQYAVKLAEGQLMSLGSSPDAILAGTAPRGELYALAAKEVPEQPALDFLSTTGCGQITKISNYEGKVIIAASNPARIVGLGDISMTGNYCSQVLNSRTPAQWGACSGKWAIPEGSEITFQSRSGATSNPDADWSPWSPALPLAPAQAPLSPPNAYFQFRLNFTRGDNAASALMQSLTQPYFPLSQPPVLTWISPQGGETWAEKHDISWKLDAPDPGRIAYHLYYSKDGGANWSFLQEDYRPVTSGAEYKFTWDTRYLQDGSYIVKLQAFDRSAQDNAGLKSEMVSKPVILCNSPPVIELSKFDAGQSYLSLSGMAKSALLNIVQLSYRINEGRWQNFLPCDKIFDSRSVKFNLNLSLKPKQSYLDDDANLPEQVKKTLPPRAPQPKARSLELKCLDSAGNEGLWKKKLEHN